MRRYQSSKMTVLVLAAAVLSACSGDGHPAPKDTTTSIAVTTSTAVTTTTTTTVVPAAAAYAFPISPSSAAHYGHAHHDYPATDIFAPCGSEVVANVTGVVQEVSRVDSWDSKINDGATRGGLFTSVIGDDGVRYYGSHLSVVAPGIDAGVRVQVGQRLGSVGNTGDARGIACHLHFGISPNCGPGDWEVRRGAVYPWPYLDSWRTGGPSSPVVAVRDWNAAHHAC